MNTKVVLALCAAFAIVSVSLQDSPGSKPVSEISDLRVDILPPINIPPPPPPDEVNTNCVQFGYEELNC